ncbi:translation initiation factor IF-3 [Candidatus Vidania fulgoroideorum]
MLIKLIDYNGIFIGLMKINEAIKIAKKKNLDLIKMNSNSNTKIYKLGNYKKIIFDKKKNTIKKKPIKKKEIKIRTVIDDFDYKIKLKKIIEFLRKKIYVKIIIFTNKNFENNKLFIEKINNDISKKFIYIKNIIFNKNNIIISIIHSVIKK